MAIFLCSEWNDERYQLSNGYDSWKIFNPGETEFFDKCVPYRTLTLKDEKCDEGKLSKDRITVRLACNMDGSEELKLLIVGRSAKPRYFKIIKSL